MKHALLPLAELSESGFEPGGVHHRHSQSAFGMVYPSASTVALEAKTSHQIQHLARCEAAVVQRGWRWRGRGRGRRLGVGRVELECKAMHHCAVYGAGGVVVCAASRTEHARVHSTIPLLSVSLS